MAKKLQVTPAGTAIYPQLVTPDIKFNANGTFHVKLNCPASERATEIKNEIDSLAVTALAEAKAEHAGKKVEKGKKPPKLVMCDDKPYVEEEDGTITFSFKCNASGKKKDGTPFTAKVGLFDAKGTPIVGNINIGSGTMMKVSFEPQGFYQPLLGAGTSLRLHAVQIIKLVEFSGRSAEGYGFGEEDGYEASSEAQAAGFGAEAEREPGDEPEASETLPNDEF
jgi:hypothetical protein